VRERIFALSRENRDAEAYALNKAEAVPAVAEVVAAFEDLYESKVTLEIAASAESLAATAEQLNGLVRTFKVTA
jgi:hypothetical protein